MMEGFKSYDAYKMASPYDDADAAEALLMAATEEHVVAIMNDPAEFAEVLRVSNPADFLALSNALLDMACHKQPLTIGSHSDGAVTDLARKVKLATSTLIKNAAAEAAREDLRCKR